MSGFTIKLLAVIFMTIDHIYKLIPALTAYIPNITLSTPFISVTLTTLTAFLGRLAFPLFAFCVSEGCRHTKNISGYLKRLFIFAVISEIPFDYAFFGSFIYLGHQNVLWTFFFGVLAIYLYNNLKRTPLLALFSVFSTATVCYVLKTDYSSIGVLLIFVLYITKSKPLRFIGAFLIISFYYLYFKGLYSVFINGSIAPLMLLQFIFTVASIILLVFYNGKQGHKLKWFFYIYYPLHLIILNSIAKLWIL